VKTLSIDQNPTSGKDLTKEEQRKSIINLLATELYARFYCRPHNPPLARHEPLLERDHIIALSNANTGTGTWEPGWKIVSVEQDGRYGVMRDQVTFWVEKAGLKTRSRIWRVGDYCRVRVGKELRYLSPGFYFAIGNGNGNYSSDVTDPLVRIYWHLTSAVSVEFIRQTTVRFNSNNIPFRAKVISNPNGYTRADSGVTYLEQRHFRRAYRIIRGIHDGLLGGLREEVPMFTKPLARGLGLAEDPGDGLSFGQSRCGILASALFAAFERGLMSLDDRERIIQEQFSCNGLNYDSPFLNKNSTNNYRV
jgi:hypothetical protein